MFFQSGLLPLVLFSFYSACSLNVFSLGNLLGTWYRVEICFLKVCVCRMEGISINCHPPPHPILCVSFDEDNI